MKQLTKHCLEYHRQGKLTAQNLHNLMNVLDMLTPAERMYILVQDLDLYRSMHQLNQRLLNSSSPSPALKLPEDLSFLKLDPLAQLCKEQEEVATQNYTLFSKKNQLYFNFMSPGRNRNEVLNSLYNKVASD